MRNGDYKMLRSIKQKTANSILGVISNDQRPQMSCVHNVLETELHIANARKRARFTYICLTGLKLKEPPAKEYTIFDSH